MDIEKLLESGSAVQVRTIGNSMTPFLLPGIHEAVIEKTDVALLKRGDAVLFRRRTDEELTEFGSEMEMGGGKLVLHRIWKRKGDTFYMVGDSQTAIEGPIRADQIKGKMVAIARGKECRSVADPWYRAASRAWLFVRPLRPVLFRIGHILKIKKLLTRQK